jgi:ribose 5-phosphate isomerase B
MTMVVAIANDHAGVALKQTLLDAVRAMDCEVLNLGTDDTAAVDYPDYGSKLARIVASGSAQYGIAICGSGIGISIAANRVAGARCALVHTPEQATLARQHNDANMIALGARMISEQQAIACVHAFLHTAFEGGRHSARVEKLG